MKLLLATMAAVGLTACMAPVPDGAFCGPVFSDLVAKQRAALEAHSETPEAVGVSATNVVLGHEAGCAK